MAALDDNMPSGPSGSADRVFEIIPSDDDDLPFVTRAIRADEAGIVRLVSRVGGSPQDCRFAAGETRSIRARKVLQTGTTAVGLEGMA